MVLRVLLVWPVVVLPELVDVHPPREVRRLVLHLLVVVRLLWLLLTDGELQYLQVVVPVVAWPRPVDPLLHLVAVLLTPLPAPVRVAENEVRLPVLQAVPFRRVQCVAESVLVVPMLGSLLLRLPHVLRQHRQFAVAWLLRLLPTASFHQWPLPVR